jgi:hypothetical protein
MQKESKNDGPRQRLTDGECRAVAHLSVGEMVEKGKKLQPPGPFL